MKALKNTVALACALLIQACSTSPSTPPSTTQPESEAKTTPKPAEKPTPQSFILRGEMVVGHETRSFIPCGSEKQYWLQLSNGQSQQIERLSTRPYQPLYGEVIGYLEPSSNTGFSADYDARFVVEQINFVTAENPKRCDKPASATRAFGNEPFWSASFEQDAVIFSKMGEPSVTLPIETTQIRPRLRDYQFADGHLKLSETLCQDTMSDSLYGWRAELRYQDTTYKGCATASNLDSTATWQGLYINKDQANLLIEMRLAPDHSVQTRYVYSDGSRPVVESGFWQQLKPGHVQVVMTHHQRQRLLSERVFQHKNGGLHVDQEQINGKVYPIAGGGITLYPALNPEDAPTEFTATASVPSLPSHSIASSDQPDSRVDHALRQYFAMHKTDPDNTRYRWLETDLNGDGAPELLAQLDWCGTGGCTLLIFENHQQHWRFHSRITLVNSPIYLGTQHSNGWQDLIIQVRGGGATPALHRLRFDGLSYDLNASTAPLAEPDSVSHIELFSDRVSPRQQGATL